MENNTEEASFHSGERDSLLIDSTIGDIYDLAITDVIITNLQTATTICRRRRPVISLLICSESNTFYCLRLRKLHIQIRRLITMNGKLGIISQILIAQLLYREMTIGRSDFCFHFRHGQIILRYSVSEHIDVLIILIRLHCLTSSGDSLARESILIFARNIERIGHLHFKQSSTIDSYLAPYELFHSVFQWYPRTTALTPSWRCGSCKFHTQRIGNVGGVTKSVFPFGSHICEAFFHNLRCNKTSIETMSSADARTVHPHQIFIDTFLGYITVHPMPPHAWSHLIVHRILKRGILLGKNGLRFE